MLLLCSNGLSSERLLASVRPTAAGCTSAALVVTADNEYKEKNYHVSRCTGELNSLGLHVEAIDLDRQRADLLLGYDVVEFIGGNPFYLLHAIRQSGAEPVLRQIAKTNILIGWSAAAFVFGPSLELVSRYSPEMNFLELTDLTGLGLTDVEVLPHYSKFLKRIPRFEETCRAYEAERHTHVIRLDDGDGVFLDGNGKLLSRIQATS
ncbi:MAG: Type 1 glutamine amidotransferase-like domain-containing protein [Candidatus Ventricola sp.]